MFFSDRDFPLSGSWLRARVDAGGMPTLPSLKTSDKITPDYSLGCRQLTKPSYIRQASEQRVSGKYIPNQRPHVFSQILMRGSIIIINNL